MRNNTTTFAFDNLNRLTSETNPLAATRSYGYDALGQLTTQIDRNGRVSNFSYDGLGRLKQEQWLVGGSAVNTLAYTYDAASQLTAASDASSAYAYVYNANGRVTSVDNLGTPNIPRVVLTSTYDNLSRRTQLAASVASTADFRTNYKYDSLSRITQITQQGQAGGNTVATKRIDFAYNAVGQYTTVTRYATLATNKLVATSTYGYDAAGRITSLAHKKGTNTLNSYTWAYDAMSRPTTQTSNDGTDVFSYDASSQVTGATHTSQSNESYSYDANGNRTVSGYTTGTNNRLTSDGTYNYQYDDEGNRTRRTEIATGKYDVYTWDHHNRLTTVQSFTSGGILTKQVQYTYDVFDRRIGKQVDADGNGTWDTTQRFVYDGEDVVLVYAGSSAGSLTNRYLVGPKIDEILADENAAGVVTWSLADNLGTVRDLAQYNTGTNTTTVVNHVKYDTFGQIKSQTNSAWQPLFAYTGREWDGDAGMYYYRARWYDARVGRFLSEDPIGFAAGDVNLSRYVANRATMWVDPSGFYSELLGGDDSTVVGVLLDDLPSDDEPLFRVNDTASFPGDNDTASPNGSNQLGLGGLGAPLLHPQFAHAPGEVLQQMADAIKARMEVLNRQVIYATMVLDTQITDTQFPLGNSVVDVDYRLRAAYQPKTDRLAVYFGADARADDVRLKINYALALEQQFLEAGLIGPNFGATARTNFDGETSARAMLMVLRPVPTGYLRLQEQRTMLLMEPWLRHANGMTYFGLGAVFNGMHQGAPGDATSLFRPATAQFSGGVDVHSGPPDAGLTPSTPQPRLRIGVHVRY